MLKISLIHPSRGRAKKAFDTFHYWLSRTSVKNEIEHILSADNDDPQAVLYKSLFYDSTRTKVLINPNKNVVQATNIAAKEASGDLLIYLSDDFKCPLGWDQLIVDVYKKNREYGYPMLIKVDDALQAFDVPVLTIPIMDMDLYNALGYFWHPDYASMFCDQHLFEICKKHNWIINAPQLIFEHEHCSVGKAERDETYIRSEANWNSGKALFEKHKMEGFPL